MPRRARFALTPLEDRSVPANGLSATYWDNLDFTGPTVSRVDQTVNFDWGTGSPDAGIDADTFSARWTGRVRATETGRHTFRTVSDDGVRVWVKGQRVIDNWTKPSPAADSGSLDMTAGQFYDVKIEYYERAGSAAIRFQWLRPGRDAFVTVPAANLFTATAAPTDLNVSPGSLPAGRPAGFTVGRFVAIDPDVGDTHTFTLTAGAGDTDNARFAVIGNELRTAQAFATPTTYSIRVRATDSGGLTVEKPVAVTVTSGQLDIIDTGHEQIPDFGTHPTVVAVRDGYWSDPETWSTGMVPGYGVIVGIGADRTVIYDHTYAASSVAPDTVSVRDGGTLTFRTDVSTRLIASNVQVLAGGWLLVGTQRRPVAAGVTAEIVIADRPLDLATDPNQFGNGLIVLGVLKVHGAEKKVNGRDLGYAQLDVAPRAGDTTLALALPVSGWRPGDQLVLPDTRQFHYGNDPYPTRQHETITLAAVSADGRTLILNAPLRYDHLGASTQRHTLLPHVGNVSRNVVVRSENPTGTFAGPNGAAIPTRGHTLYTLRADVDVRYAEYRDLGRTNNGILDTLANLKGRYAAHFHHLYGPTSPTPANGYQFTFVGNAMLDAVSPRKWPIAIHDSHYGLVEGVTVFGGTGAGITTEDGSESYNLFVGNFVVGISGFHLQREKFRDEVGADGFWLAGPNNSLRENVTAVDRAGYVIYGGDNASPFPIHVPDFPGADPHDDGTEVDAASLPIRQFVQNSGYASLKGIETWYIGHENYFDAYSQPVPESLIAGGAFWNIHRFVFEGNHQYHLTVDGLVAVGDPNYLGFYDYPTGLEFRQCQDVVVKNVSVENFRVGLYTPVKTARRDYTGETGVEDVTPTRILNSYFRNVVDISVRPIEIDAYAEIPPILTVIDGCQLDGLTAVRREYYAGRHTNIVQVQRVYVLAHHGDPTANYQVYATQQAKNFVMPLSEGNSVAAPVEGWTNEQLWNSDYRTLWGYRYAVYGDLLPDEAFSLAGVEGRVRTLTAVEVEALRG